MSTLTSTEKLDYIYNLARSLKETLAGSPASGLVLGFQKSPQADIVYIGEHEGHPWYKMAQDGGKNRVAIPHNFIAGYMTDISSHEKKSEEYGDKQKLRIHLKCDAEPVAIQSGLTTYFSRAIVSGLASLPPDFQFATTPVGIEVNQGDKGKVVLPALYVASPAGGWTKIKLDAAGLNTDDEMLDAVSALKARF